MTICLEVVDCSEMIRVFANSKKNKNMEQTFLYEFLYYSQFGVGGITVAKTAVVRT